MKFRIVDLLNISHGQKAVYETRCRDMEGTSGGIRLPRHDGRKKRLRLDQQDEDLYPADQQSGIPLRPSFREHGIRLYQRGPIRCRSTPAGKLSVGGPLDRNGKNVVLKPDEFTNVLDGMS